MYLQNFLQVPVDKSKCPHWTVNSQNVQKKNKKRGCTSKCTLCAENRGGLQKEGQKNLCQINVWGHDPLKQPPWDKPKENENYFDNVRMLTC